jgi:hypothetical protein
MTAPPPMVVDALSLLINVDAFMVFPFVGYLNLLRWYSVILNLLKASPIDTGLGGTTTTGFCATTCTVFADLSNAQCSLDSMVTPFVVKR